MTPTHIARWTRLLGLLLLGGGVLSASQEAPSLAGKWDATVVANDVEVPFTFEIAGEGETLAGSFLNGELEITSTEGRFENDTLVLHFGQYGSRIEATYRDGRFEGQYVRGSRTPYPFRAVRAAARPVPAGDVPSIDGEWKIATESSKGETAWRFIVRQSGAEVSGAILRVDGDTGELTGAYRDGRFVMSHFSGARPMLLEVTVNDDGSLTLLQNRKTTLEAVRFDSARAGEIGDPTDPSRHTTVRNPEEPFRFSFPDLEGNIVTQDDPRFAGRVVLVNITGSWCPNCHDEAPFLSELYKAYRDKGLEIVGLSFEDEDQLANPTRLRAFIEKYDLPYTFLLAGNPDQLEEKVPQAVNLNAVPTTFILGRDGRVRGVHAGFPSPASGSFYEEAKRDITSQVERLLAEPAPSY